MRFFHEKVRFAVSHKTETGEGPEPPVRLNVMPWMAGLSAVARASHPLDSLTAIEVGHGRGDPGSFLERLTAHA